MKTMSRTDALRVIESLIVKSAKAQRRLAPETWQHAMLARNLRALHVATTLITGDVAQTVTHADLCDALKELASLTRKAEKARAKFARGTSQCTLQQNRISAFSLAAQFIRLRLELEKTVARTL